MSTASIDKRRERTKAWQRRKIEQRNDVGAPTKLTPQQKGRRTRATKSLRWFLENLFDDSVFYRKFGEVHLAFIDAIQAAYETGGNLVVAMPRGSGKSSILLRAICWASLTGKSDYPILVTANDTAFVRALRSIKMIFETNDALLELWPEVIEPIRSIRSANAANYQLCHGQKTHLRWSLADGLQFPDTPYTREAGNASCNIGGGGLTGSKLRGCVQTLPDGRSLRPTVALVDDPSDRESAASPHQNRMRLDIVKSDIAKMGGPGKKMSVLVACTVIESDDLAERLLSNKTSPQYKPIRIKMLERFPANLELWQEYKQLALEASLGEQPEDVHHKFYRANRKAMDEGAEHYWPDRIEDGFESAIESAMFQWLDDPRSFASECQNEPEDLIFSDLPELDEGDLVERQHAYPVGMVPADAVKVVTHIDCQAHLLYYTVCAFSQSFKTYVLKFGTWPQQKRTSFSYDWVKDQGNTLQRHYRDLDLLGAFRQGLVDLVQQLSDHQWQRHGGGFATIDLGLIDARYQPVDVEAALHQARRPGWAPCYGVGIGAKNEPLKPRDKNNGVQGLHWVTQVPASGRMLRSLFVDVNYWKTEAHKGLCCPVMHNEAILLPKDRLAVNVMAAESYVSEVATAVTAKHRTVNEWQLRHSSGQNHLWDNLVACLAGASYCGIHKMAVQSQMNFRRPSVDPADHEGNDEQREYGQDYEGNASGWGSVDEIDW